MATISYTTSYVLNMFTFIAYSGKNTYLAGFLFIPRVNPNMGTMASLWLILLFETYFLASSLCYQYKLLPNL